VLSLPLIASATPWRHAPEQLLLAGILSAGLPADGYFLAILPDLTTQDSLARLAGCQRNKHGLHGRPLAADRFHVTLHHFGHYHGPRPDIVEMAGEAAAKITTAPFQVAFDRALSFRRNSGAGPLVLRARGRATALKKFQQELGGALMKTGLGRKVARQFTPHVTLLYDRQAVAEHAVETVSWTVTEFVLIHSLIGQTKHVVLGRWPLHAKSDPCGHANAALSPGLIATRDADTGGRARF